MNRTILMDAGATKTDLVIFNSDGSTEIELKLESGNLLVLGQEKWIDSVQKVVQEIGTTNGQIVRLVAGVSGLNTQKQLSELRERWDKNEFLKSIELVVVNDAVIGLLSGTFSKNALVLISGTGANCIGFNDNGETAKVAGIDYFADQGSGWEIGFKILQYLIAMDDGRQEKNDLLKIVKDKYQIQGWGDFCESLSSNGFNKGAIADLANTSLSWYEINDRENNFFLEKIINQAICDLTGHVETVIQKLYLHDKITDLVLIGGIIHHHPIICEPLMKNIKQKHKKINIVKPDRKPIYGAFNLARVQESDPELFKFFTKI